MWKRAKWIPRDEKYNCNYKLPCWLRCKSRDC